MKKNFFEMGQDLLYNNFYKYTDNVYSMTPVIKHMRLRHSIIALKMYSHTAITQDRGILDKWELMSKDGTWQGTNIHELISLLYDFIDMYNLAMYSEYTKDTIVIYTTNYNQVYGFLQPWITDNDSPQSVFILNYFEVRDLTAVAAIEEDESLIHIYNTATAVFKPMIINKYFPYTVNQGIRKDMETLSKNDNNITKMVYPKTWEDYLLQKESSMCGALYTSITNYNISCLSLATDRTSAYPADLLFEKHIISNAVEINPDLWKYFLYDDDKLSFGIYNISYIPSNVLGRCFRTTKSASDRAYKPGHDNKVTETFIMTSVDIKTFLLIYPDANIECTYLEEYHAGYVPHYLYKVIEHEFIQKSKYEADTLEYKQAKVKLNGINGNMARNITKEDYLRTQKKPYSAPLWGIFAISYARYKIISLGLQVDAWWYSDTDSIFCKDTEHNRQLFENFNAEQDKKVHELCIQHDLDYAAMKGIGGFKIEEIKDLYVHSIKHYSYYNITKHKYVYKQSGCNGRRYINKYTDDSWYKKLLGTSDDDINDKLDLLLEYF